VKHYIYSFNIFWHVASDLGYSEDVVCMPTVLIFTVRRYALLSLSYRNSLCLSLRLSVCHTRALCPHGSTDDHDFFTIW